MNFRRRLLTGFLALASLASCNEEGSAGSLGHPGLDAMVQIGVGGAVRDGGALLDAAFGLGPSPIVHGDAQGPRVDTGTASSAHDAGPGADAALPADAGSASGGQREAGAAEAGTVVASCQNPSSVRAGESTASLQFGGATRSYRVYVPSSYKPDAPAALVLWFHGILGSSQDYRSSGFREVADSEGFILVAPDGIDSAWNIGPCCTARRRNVDDVGFAKAVVAELTQKACIDSTRIYAAGFSMGGGLTHYLACHAADVFAAAAPSAFDLLKENVDDCKPVRAIPVASFRNSFDTFVYYDGVSDSQPPNTSVTGDTSVRINILGAEATFAAWAQIDGCTGSPEADGAGCMTYKQCRDGVEVTLCTEDDPIGGHHPGPADQMWAHLKRYRLR